MPSIDGIKEELARLRLLFGVGAVVEISLLGWLSQQVLHDGADRPEIVWGGAALAIYFFLILLFLGKGMRRRIRELRNLK